MVAHPSISPLVHLHLLALSREICSELASLSTRYCKSPLAREKHFTAGMSEEPTLRETGQKRKALSSTSDEEAAAPASSFLDWRMDPEESFSDWKIDISVDEQIHETYHVHRAVLAVGSKRSEYFVRLFANTNLKEHTTHTSCIDMKELAANFFPIMLDYVYSLWGDTKPITHANAVVLHHFGCYFEIRALRREARMFWKSSMTVKAAGTYLEHAQLFQDDQAHAFVVEVCVRSIQFIKVDSRLMEVSDAKFWLAVLQAIKGEPNAAVSTLISSFCSTHQEVLDSETFLRLTDKSVLPQLSVSAAIELLQLEQNFEPASSSELSNLQERGLEALTSCGRQDPLVLAELQRGFKDFPPLVLSQMLQRSIGKLWDCSTKLEVTTKCVPKAIVVSNGGVEAVNGTYSRNSQLRERAPRFVMDGIWNGSPAKFELYVYCAERSGAHWYISILKELKPIVGDIDFYHANICKENPWLPPKTGWNPAPVTNGARPDRSPTLSYHFDVIRDRSEDWFLWDMPLNGTEDVEDDISLA